MTATNKHLWNGGCDKRRIYTEEEIEFLKEIDRFRNRHQRIPSLVEGFRIAVRIGWRKQKEQA